VKYWARRNWTVDGSRGRCPEKSMGRLTGYVGMGSGRPRCSWS